MWNSPAQKLRAQQPVKVVAPLLTEAAKLFASWFNLPTQQPLSRCDFETEP